MFNKRKGGIDPVLWTSAFAPLTSDFSRTGAFMPAVDVTASDSDLVFTLDLPGLTADDLSIELLDDYLIVRGERTRPEVAAGAARLYAERPFGPFERRLQVPKGVDPDSVTASMDHGVLSLIVPKPERLKPKTIAIGEGAEHRPLETATA
jgi:HSP20 family protein